MDAHGTAKDCEYASRLVGFLLSKNVTDGKEFIALREQILKEWNPKS
jgi:hypothetical protein